MREPASINPLGADFVAKVTEQMLWNSNLKQSNRGEYVFESTLSVCALDFESIFRAGMLKILLQQYPPIPDISGPLFDQR
jgi:hypothetical protein